jgi:hypothetical protein
MDDLSYLIKKYYLDSDDFSQSTSSHWRKYGAFQKVKIFNSHTSEELDQTNLSVGGGSNLVEKALGILREILSEIIL